MVRFGKARALCAFAMGAEEKQQSGGAAGSDSAPILFGEYEEVTAKEKKEKKEKKPKKEKKEKKPKKEKKEKKEKTEKKEKKEKKGKKDKKDKKKEGPTDEEIRMVPQKRLERYLERLAANDFLLEQLDLQYFKFGPDVCQHICQMVVDPNRPNTSLVGMNLTGNYLGVEGAEALASALRINGTITSLNLKSTCLGAEGAGVVADSIRSNPNTSMSSLLLWGNAIGDRGALILAEVLRNNGTLTWLDLRSNCLSDVGAKAMATVLKTNITLTALSLKANRIEEPGVKALASMLATNNTLTDLQLMGCCLGSAGKQSLQKAVESNEVLTRLDLLWGRQVWNLRVDKIPVPTAAQLLAGNPFRPGAFTVHKAEELLISNAIGINDEGSTAYRSIHGYYDHSTRAVPPLKKLAGSTRSYRIVPDPENEAAAREEAEQAHAVAGSGVLNQQAVEDDDLLLGGGDDDLLLGGGDDDLLLGGGDDDLLDLGTGAPQAGDEDLLGLLDDDAAPRQETFDLDDDLLLDGGGGIDDELLLPDEAEDGL
jgi:hypothetical protein